MANRAPISRALLEGCRQLYVESWAAGRKITLDEAAQAVGADPSTIRHYAASQHWGDQAKVAASATTLQQHGVWPIQPMVQQAVTDAMPSEITDEVRAVARHEAEHTVKRTFPLLELVDAHRATVRRILSGHEAHLTRLTALLPESWEEAELRGWKPKDVVSAMRVVGEHVFRAMTLERELLLSAHSTDTREQRVEASITLRGGSVSSQGVGGAVDLLRKMGMNLEEGVAISPPPDEEEYLDADFVTEEEL